MARSIRFFIAVVILVGIGDTCLGDEGIYIGAAASDVGSDYDWLPGSDDEDRGFKLFAGVRLRDWLALEAGWQEAGRVTREFSIACPAVVGFPCPVRGSFDTRGVSLSALGVMPVSGVDLYARAGVTRWSREATVVVNNQPGTTTSRERDSDLGTTLGAGLLFDAGRITLRCEYERWNLSGESVDFFSIGISHTFR